MKVLKTITTPTRRIPAGSDLPDSVVLDGPLTRADWVKRGYLEAAAKAEAPVKPLRVASPPPVETPDT